MKNIYLILSVLFLFIGCNEEVTKKKEPIKKEPIKKEPIKEENSLIGSWQLVERFVEGSDVQTFEYGEIVIIGQDNSYFSTYYRQKCRGNGTYKYNTDSSMIEISIQCINQDLIEFSYWYKFTNNKLILGPLEEYTCYGYEGCYNKYKKITQEEEKQKKDALIGSWQLVEVFDGVLSPVQIIEDGEILTFWQDNSYSNSYSQCNGTYINNYAIVEISIPPLCLNPDLVELSYFYHFENNELILTPAPGCFEGCYYKYKKV